MFFNYQGFNEVLFFPAEKYIQHCLAAFILVDISVPLYENLL